MPTDMSGLKEGARASFSRLSLTNLYFLAVNISRRKKKTYIKKFFPVCLNSQHLEHVHLI